MARLWDSSLLTHNTSMEETIMLQKVSDILSGITAAAEQVNRQLRVIPLLRAEDQEPKFLTMRQAFAAGILVIKEISEGGSVPTLFAENRGDLPILLMDGEEVQGAKQNRILNTSVLIAPGNAIQVPVSCTEAGRWHYNQREQFQESGNVMPCVMRAKKTHKVSMNLSAANRYDADQGEVWAEIDALRMQTGAHSETGAMNDVFEQRKIDLISISQSFPLLSGQCGIIVFSGDRFLGYECLSRSDAWSSLHDKIMSSYAMDVLRGYGKAHDSNTLPGLEWLRERLERCLGNTFKGVDLGEEMRFEGPGIFGSLLYWQNTAIHSTAYPVHAVSPARPEPKMPRFIRTDDDIY